MAGAQPLPCEPTAKAAGEPDGATLLARLRAAFPNSSTRRLKAWLAAGRVRINDRVVRDGRAGVRSADAVELAAHPEPIFPVALRRVYEDTALVVVDKPPGLLTIATERERHRTVYRLLWDYLAARHPRGRPFVVHRLDRDTSGLLVVAKSPAAKRHLQAQFAARTVERVYTAVVEGQLHADRGTLESTLVEDRGLRVRSAPPRPGHGRRRVRSRPAVRPRRAITGYRVLERRRDATLVELVLGTGRRRQIRAQLAALGHPIVGDGAYGSRHDPLRRLCLHATRLGFVHPVTGTRVWFESAVPAAFTRIGHRAR